MSASFCRDCLADASSAIGALPRRAARRGWCVMMSCCGLPIAHIDCDAFYATIEKRDDPALAAEPVIVGGGRRGVVAAACYVARTFGVRSAMPMFEALRLCPHARVVRPNIEKYSNVGREVRRMMLALTPLVEPLSIDEAFLDLEGTGGCTACRRPKCWRGLQPKSKRSSPSRFRSGFPCNKFLAKIASDLDKPRGFAVLGPREAPQLPRRQAGEFHLWRRQGQRCAAFARRLSPDRRSATDGRSRTWRAATATKAAALPASRTASISARSAPTAKPKASRRRRRSRATSADFRALERILWAQTEEVSARLKEKALAGSTVTLKLKTADFKIRTRAHSFETPTQLATKIFTAARGLLERETGRHQISSARRRRQRAYNRRPGRSGRSGRWPRDRSRACR